MFENYDLPNVTRLNAGTNKRLELLSSKASAPTCKEQTKFYSLGLIQPEAEVCLNAEAREGKTAKIGKIKMLIASAHNAF